MVAQASPRLPRELGLMMTHAQGGGNAAFATRPRTHTLGDTRDTLLGHTVSWHYELEELENR